MTLFLSATFSTAMAERDRKGPPKGKPPTEAFAACAYQAEESACSFSTPDGDTVEGTCALPRKAEESLVCKPNRGKEGGRGDMKRN